MENSLFNGTKDADYMKHVKFPDAILKNWNDFTKALQEKEYLLKKQKDIHTLADTARQNVLSAHDEELSQLSESIGKLNINVNEFLTNHETDFKASPSMDLGEYEIVAETKTKYKIKRKKEAKNNEN